MFFCKVQFDVNRLRELHFYTAGKTALPCQKAYGVGREITYRMAIFQALPAQVFCILLSTRKALSTQGHLRRDASAR